MAQVCRSTCGVTFVVASEGQAVAAVLACRATMTAIPSVLRRLCCRRLGKTGSSRSARVSACQLLSVLVAWAVSGVMRSLRPLPLHRRWAPVPSSISAQDKAASSETRSPVWIATRSRAWSRRPILVVGSGAARSASVSLSVRKQTSGGVPRGFRTVGD